MLEETKDLSNIEKTQRSIDYVSAEIGKLERTREQLILHLEMLKET